MSFPELTTSRLRLTKITSSDAESIFELFSCPEVVRHYDLEAFKELTQAEALIRLFESRHKSSRGIRHRIQANTIPGNVASEKVLLKLGFKEEGIHRECAYLRGAYHDMKCFGLLRPCFSGS